MAKLLHKSIGLGGKGAQKEAYKAFQVSRSDPALSPPELECPLPS